MSPEASVYILDSFALLAYLEDEAGAEQVEARLAQAEQGEAQVLLSLINFGECLSIVEQERGVAQAEWMIALDEERHQPGLVPAQSHVLLDQDLGR